MISIEDENNLEWYFGQTAFHRSTSGGMLERANALAYDSDGNRIPRREDGQMKLKHVRTESSYTPNYDALETYATVSRRLRLVSMQTVAVFREYYGNNGARWGRHTFGRLWAISPLSDAGKRELTAIEARRIKKGLPNLGLQPAELLAQEVELQRLQPNDLRAAMVRRVKDQIEDLIREAQKEWVRTASVVEAKEM